MDIKTRSFTNEERELLSSAIEYLLEDLQNVIREEAEKDLCDPEMILAQAQRLMASDQLRKKLETK